MLTGAGLFALAPAASASTLLVSCPTGSVTGSGTVSPPISPTNTSKNTISSTASFSGCTGQETSGTVTSTQTTVAPATCAGLVNVPPKGTVTSTGKFTIKWGDGTTSSGSIKSESGGPPLGTPGIVIEKITSGHFFLAGHVTKSKTTISTTPGAGQDCTTVPISTFTFTNASPANTTQK
jgi:hypothetical protein